MERECLRPALGAEPHRLTNDVAVVDNLGAEIAEDAAAAEVPANVLVAKELEMLMEPQQRIDSRVGKFCEAAALAVPLHDPPYLNPSYSSVMGRRVAA
jgi:hypothetical protein